MSPVRCFVAAPLPAGLAESLAALQRRLAAAGARARWVAAPSIHLTLKFLGELDPPVFEQVCRVLREPVPMGGACRLEPRGIGAFPSLGRARVVWVGLAGEVERLARAALEIEARLEPLGIPRERRPFRPHLTLGRARRGGVIQGLDKALAAGGDYRGPPFTVDQALLFESRLSPQGARYTPRCTVPLA
ncbi:MAG: hypothetical protein Kow0092_12940 [Deferrisomatales bacterium]